MKIKNILLLLNFFVIIGCNQSTSLNPEEIIFAGREYKVIYNSEKIKLTNENDTVIFKQEPQDTRHLSSCPTPKLIVSDINQDGKDDLCYYYCGFMDVHINTELRLSETEPIILKYKERNWIDKTPGQDIDLDKLTGLEKIKKIIYKIDPDI